jgi:hypothetical protein
VRGKDRLEVARTWVELHDDCVEGAVQQPPESSQMQACSREQAVRLNMSLLPEDLPSFAKTITNGEVLNLSAVLEGTMFQALCAGRTCRSRKIIRLYSLVVKEGPAPAPTHYRKAECNGLPSFASPQAYAKCM